VQPLRELGWFAPHTGPPFEVAADQQALHAGWGDEQPRAPVRDHRWLIQTLRAPS
jgi:hypothetical protein